MAESGQLVYVPTSALQPAAWNPRVVYSSEFNQLVSMIRADPTFLEVRPILAMQDGTIYAGNQRYRAVCQLYREGWASPWEMGYVPVILTDITEEQAKARGLRDNNHAGSYQEIELAEVLADIAAASGVDSLPTLGFSDDELKNVMAAAGIGEHVNPFTGRRIEPPQEPQDAPQRPQEPQNEDAGTSTHVEHHEPLTITLRFDDVVAWDNARWSLEYRPHHQEHLGFNSFSAYNDKGCE